MNKAINVLVFPAGEVNSIELHDALSTCVNIKLYGGSSVDRHGPFVFKNYISGIPSINESKFIAKFNKILKQYSIDVVFPTHDTVAKFLANNQEHLEAKIIAGSKKTAEICRDKGKTYSIFADCDFVPKIYTDLSIVTLPAFAKPKVGAGSVGAKVIENEMSLLTVNLDNEILTEYLPGAEFTVDCLTDKNGALAVISPRSRDRLLAGISVSGQTQPLTDEIRQIATTINARLEFRGLWFFQIKKNNLGKFKLLEISVRCAGGMCLTRARGVNLPLLSVYTILGFEIEATPNNYNVSMDRTLISRYKIDYEYENVYIDFDDTLVINGGVNLLAVMFVYQCYNKGINIYLITKHVLNIEETLVAYGLGRNLFTKIIKMNPDDNKSDEIKPYKAIFIDNAFNERKLVQAKHSIPVFDVDGFEVLIDWRS